MTEDTLHGRIVGCIHRTLEELGVLEGASLDETTGLFGRGIGLDSIEALRLVSAAEERFDLTVDDEELEPGHFRTVGAFASFVEERLS